MKAKSKQQLADLAGVSLQTFSRWCKPYQQELLALGMRPNARLLPPKSDDPAVQLYYEFVAFYADTGLNSLYFYDIFDDPTSSYRNSEEAMKVFEEIGFTGIRAEETK